MTKKNRKTNKLNDVKLFDPEQENLDFPALCKFIRKTLGATQEQMAQKLNITTTAYAYWEYGKYEPKSWQAFNLCILYLYAKEEAAKQELSTTEQLSQNSQNHAA